MMLILPNKYLNCICVWKQFQSTFSTMARYVIPTDIIHTLFLECAQKNKI